jgi:hypothetical protein
MEEEGTEAQWPLPGRDGSPQAARSHVGRVRLLLRYGQPGTHGRLVERAGGAGRRRQLLPLSDGGRGHEPCSGGGLRAGWGTGDRFRRSPQGVRPLRGGDARLRQAGSEACQGQRHRADTGITSADQATQPNNQDAAQR